jgi:hypothetical protein
MDKGFLSGGVFFAQDARFEKDRKALSLIMMQFNDDKALIPSGKVTTSIP